MSVNWSIDIGSIITIVTIVAAFIGQWFLIRADVKRLIEQAARHEERLTKIEHTADILPCELHAQKIEAQIEARSILFTKIDTLANTVNHMAQQQAHLYGKLNLSLISQGAGQ